MTDSDGSDGLSAIATEWAETLSLPRQQPSIRRVCYSPQCDLLKALVLGQGGGFIRLLDELILVHDDTS